MANKKLTEEEIKSDPGLKEACQILFGDEADSKLQEYFDMLAEKKKLYQNIMKQFLYLNSGLEHGMYITSRHIIGKVIS